MIVFDDVTHYTKGPAGHGRAILLAVNLIVPSNRHIVLFGDPVDYIRTVIDLMVGAITPNAGRVIRRARVSFPAGETRIFIPEISVRANIQHIARLYAADHRAVVRYVEEVIDIGPLFDEPYGSLAKDTRKMLSHIVAYSIPFQTYILAEAIRGGRGGLNEVARELLRARIEGSGLIVPTRDMTFAHEFCDSAILLRDHKLHAFENVDDATKASKAADRSIARHG